MISLSPDQWSIVFGTSCVIIAVSVFAWKHGMKMFKNKKNGYALVGLILFSYLAGSAFFQSGHLAWLTFQGNLTEQVIHQNQIYLYLGWGMVVVGAFITFINILVDVGPRTRKVKKKHTGSTSTQKKKLTFSGETNE